MIFNTYNKYILTSFSKSLINITLIFFSLVLIVSLFEEITFFKNLEVHTFFPLFLSFLNAPSIIFDTLPFIFLISTQLFFINIIDKDELFIFKYSGLANTKVLFMLVIFSFCLGIILILGYYSFSSKLKSHYLEIKNKFTSDHGYLAVITENGIWLKDDVDGITNIANADKINNNLLMNVSITQFNKNFDLLQTIESHEVNIQTKNWIMKNAIISKNNSTERVEFLNFQSNFDLEKINNLFSNLSSLSLIQLYKLKKDYFSLGYSTVDIQIFAHKIYSLPIYLSVMTLLSGILMLNSKYKKNKIFNIILGIFISVVIYYVNYFFSLLGANGKIPILLSIWLPFIILILISMIGLVRLNEK